MSLEENLKTRKETVDASFSMALDMKISYLFLYNFTLDPYSLLEGSK